MSRKPVLVIMAAGMGSRYGGLKQIDPMDEYGNIIMDFSAYAAKEAGFDKVVFVIKKEHLADFKEAIGDRLEKHMEVAYVFQELTNIPEGFEVPAERVKPWGTGHAILSCAEVLDGPFAVINADDYYGKTAFQEMYRFLSEEKKGEESPARFAMVGFLVENTLSDNGTVSRGVCEVTENGYLKSVVERTKIRKTEEGAAFTEDDGKTWTDIPKGTTVSMNFWGFTEAFLPELKTRFAAFLEKGLKENPLKCECYLPFVVSEMMAEGKCEVKVLTSPDAWYGVTYREDKPDVMSALKAQKDAGLFPERLWR